MSTTSGYFDETVINKAQVEAARIGMDEQLKKDYIPKANVIELIRRQQTADIRFWSQNTKEIVASVNWLNACGITVRDRTDCVTGDGTEGSSNEQQYRPNYKKEVEFTVKDSDFRNNIFDAPAMIAKLNMTAKKNLVENFAQYVVAGLNASKGINALGTDGKGTVVGSDTTIAAAYWNETLIAYFARVAEANRWGGEHYLLSGKNMFEQNFISMFNAANADGKGTAGMFEKMNVFFDLHNVDSVNTPSYITYLIARGAMAMYTKAWNSTTRIHSHTYDMWAESGAEIGFPDFNFDVFYNTSCGIDGQLVHNFKVALTGWVGNNPTGCDTNNTGVLTMVCA